MRRVQAPTPGVRMTRIKPLRPGGRVQEGNDGFPSRAEHVHEGRRREERDVARAPGPALRVAGRSPAQQSRAENEPRHIRLHDEGSVREVVELSPMEASIPRPGIDPLGVEPQIDRVRTDWITVALFPCVTETDVVLAPAKRTWAMTRGERGRLVQEEQLRELARLQQRAPVPAAELQATRDPPSYRPLSSNTSEIVVQTATVPVHEPPGWVRDELAEGRDAVLEWHVRG
jgi:hypothetical protein